MKIIFKTIAFSLVLGFVACETSEELSNKLDHQVPECKTLTLSSNGQTNVIDDSKVTLLLWGVVPQTNLEVISLPTITAAKGSTVDISVVLSDNEALKTAEISYSDWLFTKYVNFANPEGDIPLTPKEYTFTAQIVIPNDAITSPWLEDYYFNDGSSMKITQSYHKITLTVYDTNMNKRIIPIFLIILLSGIKDLKAYLVYPDFSGARG